MSDRHRLRDRERTRSKILAAARAEFAAKGYSGARMEQIAARAGVTKELIYHYFRGKEHLFEEMRSERRADINAVAFPESPLVDQSRDPAELFAWRFQRMLADLEWVKLLTWEAAQQDVAPGEDARRETIKESVATIQKAQKDGLVRDGLDPRMLQLAVFALATYPLAFSHITSMTTGMQASDARFQKAWALFLSEAGKRLLSAGGAGTSANQTLRTKKSPSSKRATSGKAK